MRTYGKVQLAFWSDAKMQSVSERARLLALYLLACPHGNGLGCFRLPVGYVAVDMQWSHEDVERVLAELESIRFVVRSADWVLMPNFTRHNPIENSNQAIAFAPILDMVPACSLREALLDCLVPFAARFEKTRVYRELKTRAETVADTVTHTVTHTVTDTVTHTVTDTPSSTPNNGYGYGYAKPGAGTGAGTGESTGTGDDGVHNFCADEEDPFADCYGPSATQPSLPLPLPPASPFLPAAQDNVTPLPSQYAFEGQVIKLRVKDYLTWNDCYPFIRDNGGLKAELYGLDEWCVKQKKDEGKSFNWFVAVSAVLKKRNTEAAIKVNAKKERDTRPPKVPHPGFKQC